MDERDATREVKEDETSKRLKRRALRILNTQQSESINKGSLDSSLKRHTGLIKRMKHSIGMENRDPIMKDIDGLVLEKYVEEIAGASIEGLSRCKGERDVWAATEVISVLHRRLSDAYTSKVISLLSQALQAPPRPVAGVPVSELQEKETLARIARQRPVLRVCAELALVGILGDDKKSGGLWIMKALKELLAGDITLSSMPLLITFLKSYSRPFLGLAPSTGTGQMSSKTAPGTLAAQTQDSATSDNDTIGEEEELVEKDVRDRFKKMCEGYFDVVAKLLSKEHVRLQDQDRRNHEAYIRSGEIFEDRQQSYEKMTKGYEKLFSWCQTLSDLLQVKMPYLASNSQRGESIGVSSGSKSKSDEGEVIAHGSGSQWEDEEERRFYEDVVDLKDYIPRTLLNLEGAAEAPASDTAPDNEEETLSRLVGEDDEDDANDDGPTQDPTPDLESTVAPGPSSVITELIGRLPDATNTQLIDQIAIDFSHVNTKAARKRLIKFLHTSPLKRNDLVPYYGRFVATINKYTPEFGKELVAELESEFRYLHKKKKLVKELAALRSKNLAYFAVLTKFGIVPVHVILHIYRVFTEDLTGVNVDNVAALLEQCGRFLLRSPQTRAKMAGMLEILKRKQGAQNFDQRQVMLLENAYYQCDPPERGPRVHKERSPMEQFIRHILCDVISRKTLDKCFRLLRKLHWNDPAVYKVLFKMFSKPWKVAYSNIVLVAMLTYDLQRYHPEFSIGVVDAVLEHTRRGMEINLYRDNQKRIASIKYLGELYMYRMVNSRVIFDTLWSLVTFGHNEGRPLPGQFTAIDMPDDFFRVRLVCTLLDSCGMCFEHGSHGRKLDRFIIFFQMYILTKNELPMDVDFMVSDTLDTLRPRLERLKTFEEAAIAVDGMFESVLPDAEDSGDDSGDDQRPGADDDEEDADVDDQATERAESPGVVLLEPEVPAGPTEEELEEFEKDLIKMKTEAAADAKKTDRKAALSVWDTTSAPSGAGLMGRKKQDEDEAKAASNVMNFTVLARKGAKGNPRTLAIPMDSALAALTRSAQEESNKEKQQLKQIVLSYEQREDNSLEGGARYQSGRARYNT